MMTLTTISGITILFLIALCVTSLLTHASAALRHGIWTCAFAAVLLLAPLRWRMPQHTVVTQSVTVAAVPVTASTAAVPIDPLRYLPYIWALGTTLLLLRLTLNAARLRSIVHQAKGQRPILTGDRISGPVVAGLFRPVILLPEDSANWTLQRRRAVLAHEIAHIRRHDPAILVLSHIVTALYWFHPLTWLAAARLRAESERACDDAALNRGILPSGYAGHLLDLARNFNPQLAIPMATTSYLESRVKSILDPATNRSLPASATWLAVAFLTAAVLVPLTTLTLRAQPRGDGISGTIQDPTGAVVPRAKVIAKNTDTGIDLTTQADAIGNYSFHLLPPGHYSIDALVPGFKRFHVENLALVSAGHMQVDVHLEVGNISEAVTVAARRLSSAPVAQAVSPKPIRVGGNVQAAALLRQAKPVYPPELQAQGIEGVVSLQAVISKDGVPSSLKVVKSGGNPQFDMAAIDAASQWRYKPTMLNGEPIEVLSSIDITFKLTAQ